MIKNKEYIMEIDTFTDADTGKSWALRPNENNYLETLLGFCPTCQRPYTARYHISPPNIKMFLGSRCKSYWDSLNQTNHYEKKIEYCGHNEENGWKSLNDFLNTDTRI